MLVAGSSTSGLSFWDELTSGEISTAVSQEFGHGLGIFCSIVSSCISGSMHAASSDLPRITGIRSWMLLMNSLAETVRMENDKRSSGVPGCHAAQTPATLMIGSSERQI